MIFRAPAKVVKIFCVFFCALVCAESVGSQPIKVGSKNFNESYILAELMSQLLEDRGFEVERNFGLGGTIICYQGLVNGEIDIYPEYTGTIEQAILKLEEKVDIAQLRRMLEQKHHLQLLHAFGFNNTYAFAIRADMAGYLNLSRLSDLRKQPHLRYGFSYEFLERGDGWGALSKAYQLTAIPLGMEHSLSYQALTEKQIDVMDVYSTDAEIQKYDLVLLEDDKHFFPEYLAAPLIREAVSGEVKATLNELAGRLPEAEMQRLNALVAFHQKDFAAVAHGFLLEKGLLKKSQLHRADQKWPTFFQRTLTHLMLTAVALLAAMAIALPFGLITYRLPVISKPVIYMTGLLQTIPSLALLAFMIPFFGIGVKPALIALFLYALLPILRNTFTALNAIDPILKKVSTGMGLNAWQRLRYIEIPLATPNILAGVRTAAVILVGTATLAAFIGAGGLGEYIFTGVTLNDPQIIMWGAIPAALLAILVELAFEALERVIVPKHLLQKQVQ
ncbi:MAG: glycine betaine ABC transporter substrate-binding protein [bacterium]